MRDNILWSRYWFTSHITITVCIEVIWEWPTKIKIVENARDTKWFFSLPRPSGKVNEGNYVNAINFQRFKKALIADVQRENTSPNWALWQWLNKSPYWWTIDYTGLRPPCRGKEKYESCVKFMNEVVNFLWDIFYKGIEYTWFTFDSINLVANADVASCPLEVQKIIVLARGIKKAYPSGGLPESINSMVIGFPRWSTLRTISTSSGK